jgi:hypothetical protein
MNASSEASQSSQSEHFIQRRIPSEIVSRFCAIQYSATIDESHKE